MNDQHGILVESLNAIGQQLTRGNSASKLIQQVNRLAEFTNLHFGCEESLLRRHGYPGLERHRQAHQDLMSQIKFAVQRAQCGEDVELERTLNSIRGQYLDHVKRLDREYSQWLHSRSSH